MLAERTQRIPPSAVRAVAIEIVGLAAEGICFAKYGKRLFGLPERRQNSGQRHRGRVMDGRWRSPSLFFANESDRLERAIDLARFVQLPGDPEH